MYLWQNEAAACQRVRILFGLLLMTSKPQSQVAIYHNPHSTTPGPPRNALPMCHQPVQFFTCCIRIFLSCKQTPIPRNQTVTPTVNPRKSSDCPLQFMLASDWLSWRLRSSNEVPDSYSQIYRHLLKSRTINWVQCSKSGSLLVSVFWIVLQGQGKTSLAGEPNILRVAPTATRFSYLPVSMPAPAAAQSQTYTSAATLISKHLQSSPAYRESALPFALCLSNGICLHLVFISPSTSYHVW